MNSIEELDSRLKACADFVRKGSVAADIGSDHAYLPIYLVKNGICPSAVASDINKGPVERARINIMVAGLSAKITTLLADGLDKACALSPDDIIIAGMGGELIRDIIDASDYVKNEKLRLILQPMTMPEVVRSYLCEKGFNIIGEKVCVAAGKCYQIICAEYDGVCRTMSESELIIGRATIQKIERGEGTSVEKLYIEHLQNGAKIRINGMSRSKSPDHTLIAREKVLADKCTELLKYFKEN